MTISTADAPHVVAVHPAPWANHQIQLYTRSGAPLSAEATDALAGTTTLDIVGPHEKGAIVGLAPRLPRVTTVRYFNDTRGAPFHCTLSPRTLVMFPKFAPSEERGPVAETGPVPKSTARVVLNVPTADEADAVVDPFDVPDSVRELVVYPAAGLEPAPLGPLDELFRTIGAGLQRIETTFVADDADEGAVKAALESIAGAAVNVKVVSRDDYRAAIGEEQFALETVGLGTVLRELLLDGEDEDEDDVEDEVHDD